MEHTLAPPDGRPGYREQARIFPRVEEINDILQDRMTRNHPLVGDQAGDSAATRRRAGRTPERGRCPESASDHPTRALQGASAWALSISLAVLVLPVGAMLMVLNLTRGADLRLVARCAALTGTCVALNSVGWTAAAVTSLSGLLH